MQNADKWKATKVVRRGAQFQPSADAKSLSVGSRIIASCQLAWYQTLIKRYAGGRLL
jgi:hypothetical protein